MRARSRMFHGCGKRQHGGRILERSVAYTEGIILDAVPVDVIELCPRNCEIALVTGNANA